MPLDGAEAVITCAALNLATHLHETICTSPGGGLFWVAGPKASGKTLTGVKLVQCLQSVAVQVVAVQPRLQRAEITLGKLVSRAGLECEARPYASPDELRQWLAGAQATILDELQFTPAASGAAVGEVVIEFLARGGWAVVTGLSHTSTRQEFPLFAQLKPHVRQLYQLRSVCTACGQPSAIYTQRLVDGQPAHHPTVLFLPPSERVTYEPRCPACYHAG